MKKLSQEEQVYIHDMSLLSHEENEVEAIAAPTPKVRILLFIVRFLLFNIIL